MKKNSKTGAVILIALGLLCAVSAMKSCGTKRAAMQEKVAKPDFFNQSHEETQNVLQKMAEVEQQLETAFERWEELEAMKNA